MKRNQSAGLFKLVSDRHNFAVSDVIYCKIATLDVYSAVGPTSRRFIEYTVSYWDTDPTLEEFATPPKLLETQSGFSVFVGIIPYTHFDAVELEMYAIKHLLTTVPTLPVDRFFDRGSQLVRSDLSFGMGYALFALNEDTPSETFRTIYHHESLATTDAVLTPVASQTVGLVLDEERSLKIINDFDPDNHWYEDFKSKALFPKQYQFSNLVKV
jgi:hypothetical protein